MTAGFYFSRMARLKFSRSGQFLLQLGKPEQNQGSLDPVNFWRVAEISIEQKETEGLSQGQIVRRRFFRHRGALIAMIVLGLIVIMAFTSVGVDLWGLRIYGWWPYSWDQILPKVNNGVPTMSLFPPQFGEHPFGQDEVGRDIFAVVMRGAQQSIMVMVIAGSAL